MEPKHCEHCGVIFSPAYRVARRYWEKRRFCSGGCRVEGMRGERRATFDKERVPIAQRFWSKVSKRSKVACWPWVGATDAAGYGQLGGTRRRGAMKAHRVSYEIHFGAIPDGMCVCHRCDNPPCVNPAHLFLGTLAENNADRVAKGRTGDRRGEKNPNAKLTYADAVAIRELRAGGMTQQAIADRYGISQNAVSRIERGLVWVRDVT